MKTFAVHCLSRMGFGHKITNNSNDIADFEALGNRLEPLYFQDLDDGSEIHWARDEYLQAFVMHP